MPALANVYNLTPYQIGISSPQIGEKVPNTYEFTLKVKSPFYTMNPLRYENHDTYVLYSYFDFSNIYTSLEWWRILQSGRLLRKLPSESQTDFDNRLLMSPWSPQSATAIEKIVSSVFGTKPTRALKSQQVKDWLVNVDGQGGSLSEHVRKSTRSALIYGQSFTLIELPDNIPVDATSEAEQKPFIKPILHLFNAFECINWKMDRNGQLESVMFVKMFWNDQAERCWRWYIADTEMISVYEAKKGAGDEPVLISEAPHGLGMVPVVVEYGIEKEQPMIGTSFLLRLAELDIGKYLADSNIAWVAAQAAHAQLIVKSKDEKIGEMILSSSKYWKLNPDEQEDAFFLNVENGAMKLSENVSDRFKKQMNEASQLDPMGDFDRSGSMAASGIARQLSFAMSERRALIKNADIVEEFETQLLRMANYIVEGVWDEEVSCKYSDDFSFDQIDVYSKAYLEFAPIIQAPSWHKHMQYLIMSATNGNAPDLNEKCKLENDMLLSAQMDDALYNIITQQEITPEEYQMVMDTFGAADESDLEDVIITEGA